LPSFSPSSFPTRDHIGRGDGEELSFASSSLSFSLLWPREGKRFGSLFCDSYRWGGREDDGRRGLLFPSFRHTARLPGVESLFPFWCCGCFFFPLPF